MAKQFSLALLFVMIASLLSAVSAQDMSTRLQELTSISRATARAEKTDFEKSAIVAMTYKKYFDQDFSKPALQKYSDSDLIALFEANSETVFVTREPVFARNMEKILREIHSRQKSTRDQFDELYRSFVRARDFERATKLVSDQLVTVSSSLPLFKASPLVTDDTPAEWQIGKTERVAVLRTVDLKKDWQVIVVSHPKCHFSRRAMLDIYADKNLHKRLKDRIKWITPQDGSFEFDLIQQWNNQFPEIEFSVVHLRRSWPIPNFSETPVFYFLSNGKVITSFYGWPKEGSKEKLINGLSSLGILTDN